jgi:hypothetical protein
MRDGATNIVETLKFLLGVEKMENVKIFSFEDVEKNFLNLFIEKRKNLWKNV